MLIPDTPVPHSPHGSRPSYRLPRRIFIGSVASPQTLLSIKIIKRAVLGVGTSGVIRFVEDFDAVQQQWEERNAPEISDKTQMGALHNGLDDDRSSTPVPIPVTQETSTRSDGTSDEVKLPSSIIDEIATKARERSIEDAVLTELLRKHGWRLGQCEIVRLDPGSFLCPGFIDTHTHAPQVPNLGLGQQYELLDWLQYVTFPRERKFEDPIYARKTYKSVVHRMINSGTTCAAIYATLHEEATMILADICNEQGLRALVGKCQMDRNSPVDYIEKNVSASMESTKKFIDYCRDMKPYGSLTQEEARKASVGASSSGSPEMDESISRLRVTMNEIIESGKNKSNTSSNSKVTENSESQEMETTKSSSSNGKSSSTTETSSSQMSSMSATSASSKSSAATAENSISNRSSSADTTRKRDQMTRRQSSMSSTNSSSFSKSMTFSGTDSPRRQSEKQREMEYANALVQPILTPRFAISCSDALLTSISALMSRDPSLRVQTHLSENEGEIEMTKMLFPFSGSYTGVYDHFSLLTPRTILAHAIHLDEEEMELISKRKCGISHCPTSNNNLRSGASRVGEMLNRGIKVGLGTDMSGGFGMSILTAIREASVVAKVVGYTNRQTNKITSEEVDRRIKIPADMALQHKEKRSEIQVSTTSSSNSNDDQDEKHQTPAVGKTQARYLETSGSELNLKRSANVEGFDFCKGPLSVATLFYLATLGGAEVCNLAHRVGSLEVGKEFDALLVNTANGCPNLYIEEEDGIEEKLEKMLFCGDDRNIASVFVRGRVIGGSSPI